MPGTAPGWPAKLVSEGVVVRALRRSDADEWQAVRQRNHSWLQPWDATVPPGSVPRASSYKLVVKSLLHQAKQGQCLPFVIEVGGRFVGQVTVSNVARGSAQWASIGYWVSADVAGRGVAPRAVAQVIDHCFGPVGLHRIEICVRPENTNSLRVVEKLGLEQVGYAPRFLHIDGDWRDHRIFALTAEEAPEGVLARLSTHQSHQ
ncbi:GNAT family N-acetyltransferase [Nocardioides hwasunensis]|uniref:GNAT family N-acetyltransferase n=1 Tax=Nocardioides hwasunensis TaxID=397258 RepID=A0ABR8MLN8_9ACTN|nr:GNAT family protein [Nocardioides hwasunensis]MBD3916937.1 GNAT family N-acetyltransferase [Nocardioides hwasunensis]